MRRKGKMMRRGSSLVTVTLARRKLELGLFPQGRLLKEGTGHLDGFLVRM
jgi:hypothetical protein